MSAVVEGVNLIPALEKSLYDFPPQSSIFFIQWYFDAFHFLLCTLSKLIIGQYIISFFDYFIKKLQDTLVYCLPPDSLQQNDGTQKPPPEVKRPMNWLILIPALIYLRLIRFWLSVVSITIGQGEVTTKLMLLYVVAFRLYIRSVRHYAVASYSPIEILLKESRVSKSTRWQMIYTVWEKTVQTTPPKDELDDISELRPDHSFESAKGHKRMKNSLDEIDDDSSDGDLNTRELINKYTAIKDTSVDPDFTLSSEELSSESSASEESEDERTESRKELNVAESTSSTSEVLDNGYKSDLEKRVRSSPPDRKAYASDSEVPPSPRTKEQKPKVSSPKSRTNSPENNHKYREKTHRN